MNITPAKQSHIDGLVHIIKTTFHLACPENSNRKLQSVYIYKHFSKHEFKQLLASKKHKIWVAIEDEAPIGMAVLEVVSDNVAMLSKLYVLPSSQGKGVAKELFRTALDYLRKNGFEKLNLSVYSGNVKAKSFYSKQGFKFKEECDFLMETELHKDHIYELSVV